MTKQCERPYLQSSSASLFWSCHRIAIDYTVWRFREWTWVCSATAGPTSSFWGMGDGTDRKKICPDWKGIVSYCLLLWKIWSIHFWAQSHCWNWDKPLVSISQKPIHNAPKHLQRMMLCLQRYDLCITYKRGSEMYLADALSRAYPDQSAPQSSPQSEFCHTVKVLDWRNIFPSLPRGLNRSRKPPTRMTPYKPWNHRLFQVGHPSTPPETRPYLKCQDKLLVQDDIVFKSSRIVLLTALQKEMLLKIHEGHLGVESCLSVLLAMDELRNQRLCQ